MIPRNLKVLGLLSAVLVTSSVMASGVGGEGVDGQGMLTSDGPVTLNLTLTEPMERITAFFEIECPSTTYKGHMVNKTPHEAIPNGATSITVTPVYAGCAVSPSSFPITIDMNGCDYVLNIGGTVLGKEGTYDVTFDVVCPQGQEIAITLFESKAKHGEGKPPFCRLDIKPQTGLKGLHLTNKVGDLSLMGTLQGMHVARTNLGSFLCPNGTTNEGKYDFDLTVDGFSTGGSPTSIALSD